MRAPGGPSVASSEGLSASGVCAGAPSTGLFKQEGPAAPSPVEAPKGSTRLSAAAADAPPAAGPSYGVAAAAAPAAAGAAAAAAPPPPPPLGAYVCLPRL